MIYYKTTLVTYEEFLKENKTNRISKNEKIKSPGKGIPKYLNVERTNEIFKDVSELDYKEERYKHPKYEGEENISYFFKTKKDNDYRLDFVVLKEENKDLKDKRLHDKKFISVSFSVANATEENYDDLTNRYEMFDLMSRIRYLIELNENMISNGYVFMFGKPDDDKLSKYEYFVKICFPDYKLVVDYTSGFPNTNVGYYLIK